MREIVKITDLKDMLKKTGESFGDRVAYKLRAGEPGQYKLITHKEARDMVDALGTALINVGLKGKRIAVIGENRHEWELAYLSVVCGTGIVVPFDKALPENELRSVIERSNVDAIFFTANYDERIKNIKEDKIGNIKYFISMDKEESDDEYLSQKALINEGFKLIADGDRRFLDATINPEEMNIMLFTSGTTARSKVVALSHKNICANLMSIAQVIDIGPDDRMLSFLPLHHIFECTVGFLFALYRGAEVAFCDGARYIVENLNEYKITFMTSVPAIYEMTYKGMLKKFEKEGMLEAIMENMKRCEGLSMEEKKEKFQAIHNILGGELRYMISGAAALDPVVEKAYRDMGFNMSQGYGLTETSPVVGVSIDENYRLGSIGRPVPDVEVKLIDVDAEGMGELVVKGPNVMLGYFEDEQATNEVLDSEGWFKTGDLAKIEDGYIFICGRKKNVIVLKNGKNIFPDEMENLLNKIDGVKESFVYAKQNSEDVEDVKIFAKLVYDKTAMAYSYNANSEDEIFEVLNDKIKEVNKIMPGYKSIRGLTITEVPLIKTTTGKTKRQEEMKTL